MTLTTAEKLVDAEQKLHLLETGQQPLVVVDSTGERVEFSRANIDKLRVYVKSLKSQSGQLDTRIYRPLRMTM